MWWYSSISQVIPAHSIVRPAGRLSRSAIRSLLFLNLVVPSQHGSDPIQGSHDLAHIFLAAHFDPRLVSPELAGDDAQTLDDGLIELGPAGLRHPSDPILLGVRHSCSPFI